MMKGKAAAKPADPAQLVAPEQAADAVQQPSKRSKRSKTGQVNALSEPAAAANTAAAAIAAIDLATISTLLAWMQPARRLSARREQIRTRVLVPAGCC